MTVPHMRRIDDLGMYYVRIHKNASSSINRALDDAGHVYAEDSRERAQSAREGWPRVALARYPFVRCESYYRQRNYDKEFSQWVVEDIPKLLHDPHLRPQWDYLTLDGELMDNLYISYWEPKLIERAFNVKLPHLNAARKDWPTLKWTLEAIDVFETLYHKDLELWMKGPNNALYNPPPTTS